MHDPPIIRTVDARLAEMLTALLAATAKTILAMGDRALATRLKADQSPVTAADRAADAAIIRGLAELVPGLPVVSEESVGKVTSFAPEGSFALVDPLDGTKEFLAGRDEFTVNLAIVTERRPIAGFIAVPRQGLLYRGLVGSGAERLRFDPATGMPVPHTAVAIHSRKAPSNGLIAAVSRSHLDADTVAFLSRLPVATRIACGSALKFCRVAEGAADVYPRLARTFEWDVAAGDALVQAAGGVVTSLAGTPLVYGQREQDFAIPSFVAWGDPAAAARIC